MKEKIKGNGKALVITLICVIVGAVALLGVSGVIVANNLGWFANNSSEQSSTANGSAIGSIIGSDSNSSSDTTLDNTQNGSSNSSQNTGNQGEGTTPDKDTANGTPSFDSGYIPTTVTLTLHGTNAYGVTWQTAKLPTGSVVQVSKGSSFNEKSYTEFKATVTEEQSYNAWGSSYSFYVSKAVIKGLEPGTTYTYRCYDKTSKMKGDSFSFKTKSKSSSFKFIHLSDTQVSAGDSQSPDGSGTGDFVANNTMLGISKNGFKPEFILHTGDIVEWSKYESYWDSMINTNKKYFAGMPVMALSGNHETTYRNGTSEIYKHFNYDIPSRFKQNASKGFSYSYDYGNTKFIMLNTNNLVNNKLSDADYNWLADTLKYNDKKWTIVSMHHPMYSVGSWGADPSKNAVSLSLREQLSDLFAQEGVDLVLQGHDHVYSNTYPIGVGGTVQTDYESETIKGVTYHKNPNGVIYAMHGPSGNQLRDENSNLESKYYEYHSGSGKASWAEIEVTDSLLTVKVYNYNAGQTKLAFSYGIKK